MCSNKGLPGDYELDFFAIRSRHGCGTDIHQLLGGRCSAVLSPVVTAIKGLFRFSGEKHGEVLVCGVLGEAALPRRRSSLRIHIARTAI